MTMLLQKSSSPIYFNSCLVLNIYCQRLIVYIFICLEMSSKRGRKTPVKEKHNSDKENQLDGERSMTFTESGNAVEEQAQTEWLRRQIDFQNSETRSGIRCRM